MIWSPGLCFTFQSLLLFTNVIMDSAGIDYHVILAGNLFQHCLDNPGLQQELLCALCKQTSRIMTHSSKHGVQVKKQHSIKHTRVSHYFLVSDPYTQSNFLNSYPLFLFWFVHFKSRSLNRAQYGGITISQKILVPPDWLFPIQIFLLVKWNYPRIKNPQRQICESSSSDIMYLPRIS